MSLAWLEAAGAWVLPAFLAVILGAALFRRVPAYSAFIEGAKEGFDTFLTILPHLVGMLAALAVFQSSGALKALTSFLAPYFRPLGFPPELLPLALLRPFSGAASMAVVTHLMGRYGPDSEIGRLAAIMQGSTDTTFYVLTVYFGSVGIVRERYAVKVGLIGDAAGILAALLVGRWFFST
ncbi:MAG: spore maturation protein [Brockia lithotrophica]|nr:spore maturation protein [Brockia lithotrophica]MBT9253043.1 spore maturation protein [Brockia lithotrophica]